MRLNEVLEEHKVQAEEFVKKIGIDPNIFNQILDYQCLPIPETMKNICKELECEISDIYKDSEVFYKKTKSLRKDSNTYECYRLTANMPNEVRKYLKVENLRELGYKSVTDWVWTCIRKLMVDTEKKNATKHCDC